MGLAINVGNPCLGYDEEGVEWYRQRYRRLAEALAAHGVPGWSEPEAPPPPSAMRSHCASFPYGHLQHLMCAYAQRLRHDRVTPLISEADFAAGMHIVSDMTSMLTSHLLCHSDTDGFYVPVAFEDPLFLPEDVVEGSPVVGSSHVLLEELVWVGPAIGVRLESDGSLSDGEAARLLQRRGDPFEIAQNVWLTLHEACRASVAHGNAIVYS